jgi:N-acetylglucosamine-6-sulfatase
VTRRTERWVVPVAVAMGLATILAVLLVNRERLAIGSEPAEPPDERPSVVVVVADDLDMALFDSLTGMPSVSEGRSFRRMFVTTPLCCPSKTSILRGQYSHSHGVLRNDPPDGGLQRALELDLESSTIATWLDDAGYETGFFGRYLIGYGERDSEPSYVPPGWDHFAGRISLSREGYEDLQFSIDGRPTLLPGNADAAGIGWARQVIAAAGERPYFVMIAAMAPHAPWPGNDPATRGETMPPVEDLVEQLLREVGPDTYVIFTSDNGYHLTPTPGKSQPYDTDTMVPLVVWGPDVAVGTDDEHIVANIDLAPTIADWAGVTPPSFVEGRSLVPLTRGQKPPWRDEIQLELVGAWQAVRTATELDIDWADGRHEVIPGEPDQ